MPTKTLPTFARRLRDLRAAAGLSGYALAKATGLDATYLGRLERGQQAPSWATVQALARALGVSTEELRDQ